jgi:hypothetical protein
MTPITTPPIPGTEVNVDDRSIAERINVRLSVAWLLMERGYWSTTPIL